MREEDARTTAFLANNLISRPLAARTTTPNTNDSEIERILQDALRPLCSVDLSALNPQTVSQFQAMTQLEAAQVAARRIMDLTNSEQSPNVDELLKNLGSRDDPVRKMAAFKLQSLINDPSFAETFVQRDGLPKLRLLVLESSGNTLAYGLASFARLLDVDQGWEAVDDAVVEKVVELVVCQPLVNILRGAMAILVAIVSKPYNEDQAADSKRPEVQVGGFSALKPAIGTYPQFLEMLVSRLSSADHALCANALQLINSLMRDAITNDQETEWPKFIKRIQDLGVIKAVYMLMKGSALQDLAHPLIEFQNLTKVLLRRWRDVPVDLQKPEHRRTIKAVHLSSNPEKAQDVESIALNGDESRKHHPRKWRRLGFPTEQPESAFEMMGFLGMMDLSDYVRKNQEDFQHQLMEQSIAPEEKRCPIAQASLTLTLILFEHFEVERNEDEESRNYLALESRSQNFEKAFKPLLLHWSRLHVAGLYTFLRLWKAAGAETTDFHKIADVVRILVESIIGGADRSKTVEEIEKEMAAMDLRQIRQLQMEIQDLQFDDIWGLHLQSSKEEVQSEATQLMCEQRIRCMEAGQWFPLETEYVQHDMSGPVRESIRQSRYRFVRLASDRRYLHWGDFEHQEDPWPTTDQLPGKVDTQIISSVTSGVGGDAISTRSGTAKQAQLAKVVIQGYLPRSQDGSSRHARNVSKSSKASSRPGERESVLLTFMPPTHESASELVDGLLFLLQQQPITAPTNKYINQMADMALKVRLLNLRYDEHDGMIGGMQGTEMPEIPSREGLDEDYYYQI